MLRTIWDEAIVGDRLVVSLHTIWGITESSAMGPKMNAWGQRHLDGLGAIWGEGLTPAYLSPTGVSVAALRSPARTGRPMSNDGAPSVAPPFEAVAHFQTGSYLRISKAAKLGPARALYCSIFVFGRNEN
jgi:hypothetical protein